MYRAFLVGDAMNALRITLIATAFLEAEIDRLSAEVSSGYARRQIGIPNKETMTS